MRRIDFLLDLKEPIRHPEDVKQLRESISVLQGLNDGTIQKLYSDWSDGAYCAGWILLDLDTFEEFERYLLSDHTSPTLDWLDT